MSGIDYLINTIFDLVRLVIVLAVAYIIVDALITEIVGFGLPFGV